MEDRLLIDPTAQWRRAARWIWREFVVALQLYPSTSGLVIDPRAYWPRTSIDTTPDVFGFWRDERERLS